MIYFNDNFYDQIEDVIDDLDLDSFGDDEVIKVENCTLEPIIEIDADMLADCLESQLEDRHSEDGSTNELNKIIEVFRRNIDFEKINSEFPKLWYPNRTFETYTKAQILDLL